MKTAFSATKEMYNENNITSPVKIRSLRDAIQYAVKTIVLRKRGRTFEEREEKHPQEDLIRMDMEKNHQCLR